MEELVTIGGQSFIFDQKLGWIDRKTKAPADEKLLKLLNTVSPNRASPADKKEIAEDVVKEKKDDNKTVEETTSTQPQENMTKLRTKVVKGVDPVNIGGQRFVYSNNGWVDEKTKQPAPKNLLKLFDTLVPSAKESMGAIGEIQADKIKAKKSSNLQSPKINKLFVKMIDEIAQIDAYFAAKVSMKRSEVNSVSLQQKENLIENVDKSAEITKAAVESSGGSTLAKLGGVAGLAALIAVAYDPLYDEIKKVYEYTKTVGTYVTDFSKKINGFLEWFLDDSKATKFNVDHPQVMSDQELRKMRDDKLNSYTDSAMPPLLAKPSLKTPSGDLKSKPVSNPWASAMTGGNKPNFVQNPKPQQKATNLSMPAMPAVQAKAFEQNSKMYDAMTTTKSTIMQPRGAERANIQTKQNVALANGVPKGDMHSLRKWLVSSGFAVSEQKGYDKVGKHSRNSKHYSGDAIDVNIGSGNVEANNPEQAAKFDVLAKQLKDAGYSVIWRAPGHYNHLHVARSGPSTIGSGGGGVDGVVDSAVKIAQESFEEFIKIVKKVGSTDTEFKPIGYDKYRNIDEAQNRKNMKMIEAKTKKEAPIPELPNLNMGTGTVHTPKRSSESSGVINQYISYFN